MTRIVVAVLVSLLGLSAAPAALNAQDAAPAAAISAQVQEPAFTAEEAAATSSGLPRSGVDRTMRGYWHLFIAFAATWLLLFGYAISLGRRFGSLERRLERQG